MIEHPCSKKDEIHNAPDSEIFWTLCQDAKHFGFWITDDFRFSDIYDRPALEYIISTNTENPQARQKWGDRCKLVGEGLHFESFSA